MKKCFLVVFSTLFLACTSNKQPIDDFSEIKKKGKLTIVTMSSSTSYFIYKDEPMGYDYDLCKSFCDEYGLELEVKVAENTPRLLEILESGEADLVAYGISVDKSLKDSVIYCGLEQESYQVLVQRSVPKDSLIKDVTQLVGQTVYVKENTKYHTRLENLNAELGGGLLVKDIEKDTVSVEDLIQMVSEGEIKYTVSDENIARLNKTYYKNIDISLPVSFQQRSQWAVRRDSPELAKAIDAWFDQKENKLVYQSVMKKYFELSKRPFDDTQMPSTVVIPKGAISPFDDLFKKYAGHYDWRMLAAMAYQESRFRTNLSSWAGAVGLMGLMPRTAKSLGLSNEDRLDPELSIKASVELLKRLEKMFSSVEDPTERMKFMLASYNGGNGHISDARALTRKYGANPNVWDENVRKYLALKRNPEFYNDPVCKNGYFRGTETLNYVDDVFANWEKYKGKAN